MEQNNDINKSNTRTIESEKHMIYESIESDNEEYLKSIENDEFISLFNGEKKTKILITTTDRYCYPKTVLFLKEFSVVLPGTEYLARKKYTLTYIKKFALNRNYSHLIIVQQNKKNINGMYICLLPKGPTMFFHLSGLILAQDIENSVTMTDHNPEIITKNFTTKIGRRVSRQLKSLFPIKEEHFGRRVIIFQNQRDFIFFRHYKYVFTNEGEKANLAEIGPRFTLKLRFIKNNFLDLKSDTFEFKFHNRLHATNKDFFL